MNRLFNITSHQLTEAQINDAKQQFGTLEVVELPPHLKRKWGAVPPELTSLVDFLSPIQGWIREMEVDQSMGDIVMIQGDATTVFRLVTWLQREYGMTDIFAATTKRTVVETVQEDGSIRKISQFQHVKFRRY